MTVKAVRDIDAEVVARLRHHLRESTTDLAEAPLVVPADRFVDPLVAQQERDELFRRVPLVVAHGSELPAPYDFLTVDLVRNRALVVRQADGKVRAFLNVCRHRGAQLESDRTGSCRVISCPYHGWSYTPDGSLRNITYDSSFGDVNTEELGLIELPTEERHGLVWVVDAPGAPIDIATWLGPEIDDLLGQYQIEQLLCYRQGEFVEPANWKIMQDAFLDGYHVKYAHASSAGGYIHTNVHMFEAHGPHSFLGSARKSIDNWVDRDPDDGTTYRDHIAIAYHLFPNCTLLQQPDHLQVLTFHPHPTDPLQSRMEMRLLVPALADRDRDEASWTRRWEKNWEILMAVLRDEDFPLLRGEQAALTSVDAGPLVLGRNEVANQHFHRMLRAEPYAASHS